MKYFLCYFLITLSVLAYSQELKEIKLGDSISSFIAIDDSNKEWKLENITTDFVVVYFYPAAMTPSCTKQACSFRDLKSDFENESVSVIGISGDAVKNLVHFKDTYNLNFTLLSDFEGKIANLFGVPTFKGDTIIRVFHGVTHYLERGLTTKRWTFILNKKREIIYKKTSVDAENDSKTVLKTIIDYKNQLNNF